MYRKKSEKNPLFRQIQGLECINRIYMEKITFITLERLWTFQIVT